MPSFQQFIRERQYLANVTPATLEWYKNSLKWLPLRIAHRKMSLKDAVLRMREKGLKATGCNSRHPRHQRIPPLEHCGR